MTILGILAMVLLGAAVLWWRGDGFAFHKARTVRVALDHGRIDEASLALERWLKSSPGSADAHYFKARIAWIQNDLPTVDQELARAQELGYSWQQLARLRGLLLARGNQKSQAESLLRWQFETSNTLDPEVSEALARLYLGSFRLNEAAVILDRWMREAPRDARPYVLQTEIDLRDHASSEVIIDRFQEALNRDSSLDQTRLGLAGQLHLSHRFAEAASHYSEYLARQPEDPLGYLGAGQNALDMGDERAAGTLLDRALALAPDDSEVLAAQAKLALRRGQLPKALSLFEQSIKAHPFDQSSHYQRMLILSRLGRKAEAEDERQTVKRLKREQSRFAEISDGLVRNPLDPQLRSEAARWLMDHGRDEEAVEWANLVLQSDPSHPAMNRLLADYYRKKGQLGLANFYESLVARPARHSASTTP